MLADWIVIPRSLSSGKKSVVVLPVSTEPATERYDDLRRIDSVNVVLPESVGAVSKPTKRSANADRYEPRGQSSELTRDHKEHGWKTGVWAAVDATVNGACAINKRAVAVPPFSLNDRPAAANIPPTSNRSSCGRASWKHTQHSPSRCNDCISLRRHICTGIPNLRHWGIPIKLVVYISTGLLRGLLGYLPLG